MQFFKILCTPNSFLSTTRRGITLKTYPDSFRFVQFSKVTDKNRRVGLQIGKDGDVVDLTASGLPNSLIKCMRIENFLDSAARLYNIRKNVVSKYSVRLLAPVTNPDKIICAAANYVGYCKASKIPVPQRPIVFSKFPSTIIGPNDTIRIPAISNEVDWEAELAVVIGKRCKNIDEKNAAKYIFGYTLAQDITARDWNSKNGGQFVLGKSMDTFCPMGPAIVTKQDLNINQLGIKCLLNGKLKQNGNTSDIIFKTEYLIAYLSKLMTLLPGDVILTGTPDGVAGHSTPPRYLKCGDVLKSELECIGQMLSSAAKVERWFELIEPMSISRPESGFVSSQDQDAEDDEEKAILEGTRSLLSKLSARKQRKLLGYKLGKVTTF